MHSIEKSTLLYLGIAAVNEERLNSVSNEDQELSHLKPGQVFLPAEVRLYGGTQGGQEVIAVHHYVDSAVEEPTEGGVAASHKL